ncbi:MAG: sugar transferase [Lachnospira sp.]
MNDELNRNRRNVPNAILFFADIFCMFAAYYLSGYLWLYCVRGASAITVWHLLNLHIMTLVVSVLVMSFFMNIKDNFIARSDSDEIKAVVVKCAVFGGVTSVYEFLQKYQPEQIMPRGIYVLTIVFGGLLMLFARALVKKILVRIRLKHGLRVVMITLKDRAEGTMYRINQDEDWTRRVSDIIIVDADMTGEKINGVRVGANKENMMTFIKNEIVDEVYIDVPHEMSMDLRPIVMELEEMGITVHLKLEVMDSYRDFASTLGKLGDVSVATFANRIYDGRLLFIKRVIDIVGSIVGMLIMFVAMIFVVPAIKIESKGPVFFKQKRVGKNGRYFYIYKFRSMYIDAEERKKDLMAQNEMSGLMFKMKDDPRITKVGKFIRKTSIDELPQFINVFLGQMSLVGTRPPTVEEFKQYEGHHKRRLSMKPGITGMWQAYGRLTVSDFEEIVKMDLKYIDNWSLLLDFKILLRTVVSVFSGQ